MEKVKLDGDKLLGLDDQLKRCSNLTRTFSENPAKWAAAPPPGGAEPKTIDQQIEGYQGREYRAGNQT